MNRIGAKLFMSFLGMAILTISILWLVQAVIMKDSYLNNRVTRVEAAVSQAAQSGDIDLNALKDANNINLILLNADGSVRSTSQGVPLMGMVIRTSQAMVGSQMDGTVQVLEASAGAGRYALLGQPVKGGGYLVAVFSLADVDAASTILREQLWLITILLVAFSVILAVILTRKFAVPIRAVTGAAHELAAGNLNIQLPVPSRDEIGELTMALNDLSVQLHQNEDLRKELIANVSHELRAPLAVIRGYAETVRDVSWPIEEKRTAQLSMISEEASRLSKVVTDILDYSKLQAGIEKLNISSFPVKSTLEQLMQRYEMAAADRGVRIDVQAVEHDVRFDKVKFDQVMDNLLNNAISHADKGTSVRIFVTPGEKASRIAVQNQGSTIPPDEIDRIWDRYYRAQTIGETRRLGTGLGLSIVKSILQKHGVTFGVYSEHGQTAFWFDTQAGNGR